MAAPPIFKKSEHQLLFEKQGFLILPSFLNEDELHYMDNLFDELHPELPQSGFFAGSYSADSGYKTKVSNEVKRVFNRSYELFFQNYAPFGGAYLYKIPSKNSDLFMHQDWTIVDESKHVALNIWVPLCDITIENGPLMVLPGSHYDIFPVLRAPTMEYFFDADTSLAFNQLEPVLVKAGTAVVLNQSLIHYSPPNASDKIRKAITAGLKTKDAQMIFHFQEKSTGEIERFEMEDEFLIQFENFFEDIHQRPKMGKSIGKIDYKVPILPENDLELLIRKMKTEAGFEYCEPIKPGPIDMPSDFHDNRKPFWKVYTPMNILREIQNKMKR